MKYILLFLPLLLSCKKDEGCKNTPPEFSFLAATVPAFTTDINKVVNDTIVLRENEYFSIYMYATDESNKRSISWNSSLPIELNPSPGSYKDIYINNDCEKADVKCACIEVNWMVQQKDTGFYPVEFMAVDESDCNNITRFKFYILVK